jgi:hypothetical protein
MSFFEESRGSARTAKPYPKVSPSRIGGALLPWACPHCSEVKPAMADARKRIGYTDESRGFSWCPACRGRYIVNERGTALVGALPAGATVAPALVERNGVVKKLLPASTAALDLLGSSS